MYINKEKSSPKNLLLNDYDDISSCYHEVMGEGFTNAIFPYYKKILTEVAENNPSFNMTDLGCGDGFFIKETLSAFLSSTATGIDTSKNHIKKAICENTSRANFTEGSIVNEQYPVSEIVTMNFDVINHIQNLNEWEAVFSKVFDCLSPGGVFLFDMNSIKRLEEDFSKPELIQTKTIEYVGTGFGLEKNKTYVARELLMETKTRTLPHHKTATLIREIAPKILWVTQKLEKAGFTNVESKFMEVDHPFFKKRYFVKATKSNIV